MQITRENYVSYAKMVQQMFGNGKAGGNDALAQCDYGNFALRFKPVDIKFTEPDWDKIATKRDKPAMSEEEFKAAIEELARKEFASGKRDDEAYRNLCTRFYETVSPDRKAIYEESMKKTGGKMNAACMFWDSQGNKTLSYRPIEGQWDAINTKEEGDRARLFTSIYNDELKRLKKEYGENAKGKVSFQQLMNDAGSSTKQYGEGVVVEFSGDGLAKLAEGKKNYSSQPLSEEVAAKKAAKQTEFDSQVVHLKNTHPVANPNDILNGRDDMAVLKEKAPELYKEINDLNQSIINHKDGEKFGARFLELHKRAAKVLNSTNERQEGKDFYRNQLRESAKQGVSYEEVSKQREIVKMASQSISTDYKAKLTEEANRLKEKAASTTYTLSNQAEDYVKAYAKLYDEIVQGYADGTRESYVADENAENGYRKLTMEEELDALDAAFQKTSEATENSVAREKKMAGIFEKHTAQLAKINGKKTSVPNTYGKHQEQTKNVPENIGKNMVTLANAWKSAYAASGSKESSLKSIASLMSSLLYEAKK